MSQDRKWATTTDLEIKAIRYVGTIKQEDFEKCAAAGQRAFREIIVPLEKGIGEQAVYVTWLQMTVALRQITEPSPR